MSSPVENVKSDSGKYNKTRNRPFLIFSVMLSILILTGCETTKNSRQQPVGLRMTGHGERGAEVFQFEIVEDGFGYYFRKEKFKPFDNMVGGTVSILLVSLEIDAFAGQFDQYLGATFGPGGAAIDPDNGPYVPEVARRLWAGPIFRDPTMQPLRANLYNGGRSMLGSGHFVEEFSEISKFGDFQVPCLILWLNKDSMPETTIKYHVDKVTFLYRHDYGFFERAKVKYFRKDYLKR